LAKVTNTFNVCSEQTGTLRKATNIRKTGRVFVAKKINQEHRSIV